MTFLSPFIGTVLHDGIDRIIRQTGRGENISVKLMT